MPSSVTSTQLPGTGSPCCDRKIALGLATPFRPFSVIANTPISLTAPKRFLIARTRRKLECGVALEIQHRVDHVLEHARAGERAFLGDVADQHDARCRSALAARVRCAAHSRTCATEPGAEVSWSEYTVWIESITATAGCIGGDGGEDLLQLDLGQHPHLRVVQAEPARAQRDLRAAFLAGDVERRHAARAAGRRAPAAAASTCRCRGRRRSAPRRPATMPPPSTRSSSPMPVGVRSTSLASMSASAATAAVLRQRREAVAVGRRRLGHGLDQRVPGLAVRALALPARAGCRRIRCRCRWFFPWPCSKFRPRAQQFSAPAGRGSATQCPGRRSARA